MKKTIVTLMAALTGVAMADETPLTLNVTELKASNTLVLWTDDIAELESWAFTFTLDTQRAALSDQDLLFLPDANDELKFAMNSDGSLEFYGSAVGGTSICSEAGMITVDPTVITLRFVATEDKSGAIVGGTLSAIVGEKAFSTTLTGDMGLTLSKTGNDGIRVWSNGANEHFTNMTLTKLNNVVIPEPTSATLSLLALAGLAARRRRK